MSKQIPGDSSKVFRRDYATHSLQIKLVTSLPVSNNWVELSLQEFVAIYLKPAIDAHIKELDMFLANGYESSQQS